MLQKEDWWREVEDCLEEEKEDWLTEDWLQEDRSQEDWLKQCSLDRESECRHCRSRPICQPKAAAGKTIWSSFKLPFSRACRTRIHHYRFEPNLWDQEALRTCGSRGCVRPRDQALTTALTQFEVRQRARWVPSCVARVPARRSDCQSDKHLNHPTRRFMSCARQTKSPTPG